jgi:hypothetical protein
MRSKRRDSKELRKGLKQNSILLAVFLARSHVDQKSFFKGDEIVTPGSSMGEYAGFKLNETALLNEISSTKFYQV